MLWTLYQVSGFVSVLPAIGLSNVGLVSSKGISFLGKRCGGFCLMGTLSKVWPHKYQAFPLEIKFHPSF